MYETVRLYFMTCYSPLQGYACKELTAKGKRMTVFDSSKAQRDEYGRPVERTMSCRQCIGCRLLYSRDWSVRCMHEASLYTDNCFITLTYNDKFLPRLSPTSNQGTLFYPHWTNFMKRLRKHFAPRKIRFYMGPEYGEISHRPHYHAILFNLDFDDKFFHMKRGQYTLFRSPTLEKLWSCPKTGESYGYSSIGSVSILSAAYVARYMLKKVKGDDPKSRYYTSPDICGEVFKLAPEKARMSNRYGIAREWFQKFKDEVYPSDTVILNGVKYKPPSYYDSLLEKISTEDFEEIKRARELRMEDFMQDNTPERLSVREVVTKAQLSLRQRRFNSELYND